MTIEMEVLVAQDPMATKSLNKESKVLAATQINSQIIKDRATQNLLELVVTWQLELAQQNHIREAQKLPLKTPTLKS